MSTDEAKEHLDAKRAQLQPAWAVATKTHESRLADVISAEVANRNLTFWQKIGYAGVHAKERIAATRKAADEAAKPLKRFDEEWKRQLPSKIDLLREEADKVRDQAELLKEQGLEIAAEASAEVEQLRQLLHELERGVAEQKIAPSQSQSDMERLQELQAQAEALPPTAVSDDPDQELKRRGPGARR
jgi:uncharacterized coiled-coil DUF342 family protein